MPKLQPVDASFLDDAPTRLVVEVEVAADRSAVWQAIIDQPKWVDWFDGMSACDPQPPVWTAPGDTRTVTVNRMKVHERAIVVNPETEYGFMIESWPIIGIRSAAEGIRLADADGGGTTLTYIGAFALNGIVGKVLWRVLEPTMRKAWQGAFVELGRYVNQ